jgi:hypothetical protein
MFLLPSIVVSYALTPEAKNASASDSFMQVETATSTPHSNCPELPEPVNVAVHPSQCVEPGVYLGLSVVGYGFEPYEDVSVSPGVPGDYERANENGMVSVARSTPNRRGRYEYHFSGVQSGHQTSAIIYVMYDLPTPTRPPTRTPLPSATPTPIDKIAPVGVVDVLFVGE